MATPLGVPGDAHDVTGDKTVPLLDAYEALERIDGPRPRRRRLAALAEPEPGWRL
jgi:hypothetical protein